MTSVAAVAKTSATMDGKQANRPKRTKHKHKHKQQTTNAVDGKHVEYIYIPVYISHGHAITTPAASRNFPCTMLCVRQKNKAQIRTIQPTSSTELLRTVEYTLQYTFHKANTHGLIVSK
mmetsp:Transcript_19293/g.41962  ORF Transcript_19293/g.41962 Transcript_19293/m.41962 type:complete len:119 (-) Transcript_19293:354-710(-)